MHRASSIAGWPLILALALPCTAQQSGLPELVARHCSECHTGDDAERGFQVAPLFVAGVAVEPLRVALALQRVRSRTMPPPDAPQPDERERVALASAFAALVPMPADARIATVRRLSRAEYEHTVRDLLGVTIAASELLPDDARAYGFDNQGDVQNASPLQFERWLDAANAIATAVLADPAARARVFADDRPLATTLPPFLLRAFRRPPTDAEIAERVALHDAQLRAGRGADAARRAVLGSVLASPAFLYRAEVGRADAPARLTVHELAVRLAYTLTASTPDDALLARAQDGSLAEPAVLRSEARRLVAATGGRSFAVDFAAQWLRYRDVLTTAADFRRYPQIWNGALRPAFFEEAAQLCAEIARDNGSVLWLLDCDHTWVDATLAKHYGLSAVQGSAFVRVPLADRRRGGVLGMAAMLMVSSYPLRTSPVLRGRWILDLLLDAATPPPPPGVGTLAPDEAPDDKPSAAPTLREQLERHRKQRSCAACHAQIDPLGFALENFDVLGQWRTELHGVPIDARGELPDGTAIDGPIALKDALLARSRDFVRTLVARLLVYAIGRQLVAADEPEVQRIVDACIAGEHRFLPLLDALVTSPLFTMRDAGGER